MSDVTLDTKKLDALVKAFKDPPSVRVGILASRGNGSRSSSDETNAEIGARHEFGSDGMPVRSFLRVPIAEHLSRKLEESGAFKKKVIDEVIASKRLFNFMKKIGVVAESIVAEAFASSGFGRWAPWKGSYKSRTGLILVDTHQLRDSISSGVV